MSRVMIVDEHTIVRDGLAAILTRDPQFEIVGLAGDADAAVATALSARPDVLLIDLDLPGPGGTEVIRRVKAHRPETRILILTAKSCHDGSRIYQALDAGTSGYLLKSVGAEELIQEVRIVAGGGSLLQPGLVSRLLSEVRQAPGGPEALLTDREQEVLQLLAAGQRNKEIAASLGIAESTVKFHAKVIFDKLGATSRAEAVALAFKRALVP